MRGKKGLVNVSRGSRIYIFGNDYNEFKMMNDRIDLILFDFTWFCFILLLFINLIN